MLKSRFTPLRFRCTATLPAVLLVISFAGCETGPDPLTAEMPLHLEEHLDAATIVGSEVPAEVPSAIEWRFDEPQPEWKPAPPWNRSIEPAQLTRTEDALRVTLTEATRPDGDSRASIYINLPDWRREDWAYVLVRARTSEEFDLLGLGFNLREDPGSQGGPFRFWGEKIRVIYDGSVQTRGGEKLYPG